MAPKLFLQAPYSEVGGASIPVLKSIIELEKSNSIKASEILKNLIELEKATRGPSLAPPPSGRWQRPYPKGTSPNIKPVKVPSAPTATTSSRSGGSTLETPHGYEARGSRSGGKVIDTPPKPPTSVTPSLSSHQQQSLNEQRQAQRTKKFEESFGVGNITKQGKGGTSSKKELKVPTAKDIHDKTPIAGAHPLDWASFGAQIGANAASPAGPATTANIVGMRVAGMLQGAANRPSRKEAQTSGIRRQEQLVEQTRRMPAPGSQSFHRSMTPGVPQGIPGIKRIGDKAR